MESFNELAWHEIATTPRTPSSTSTATRSASGIGAPAESEWPQDTRYYLKLVQQHDSYCLLITDCLRVWLERVDAHQLEVKRKQYVPNLRIPNTLEFLQLLQRLLTQRQDRQTHVISIGDGLAASTSSYGNNGLDTQNTSSLTLESSMIISVYTFIWIFHCKPYGNNIDSAVVLKHQMFLPLLKMVKMLSFHLQAARRKRHSSRHRKDRVRDRDNNGSNKRQRLDSTAPFPSSHNHSVKEEDVDIDDDNHKSALEFDEEGANAFEKYSNDFDFGQVNEEFLSSMQKISSLKHHSLSEDAVPQSVQNANVDLSSTTTTTSSSTSTSQSTSTSSSLVVEISNDEKSALEAIVNEGNSNSIPLTKQEQEAEKAARLKAEEDRRRALLQESLQKSKPGVKKKRGGFV